MLAQYKRRYASFRVTVTLVSQTENLDHRFSCNKVLDWPWRRSINRPDVLSTDRSTCTRTRCGFKHALAEIGQRLRVSTWLSIEDAIRVRQRSAIALTDMPRYRE